MTIDYEKFVLMNQELGENPSDEDSCLAILKTFYPNDKRPWVLCVEEFNKEIVKPFKGKLKLDLDFENKPAEYYITADTYLSRLDLVNLYNHLSNSNLKSISLQLATEVKRLHLESVDYFKDKYEWIFNPPSLPSSNKFTLGKQLRQEFQEHYGAYAEITYLISNGNPLKFDEVNKMKLSDYLATGEYLIRKRAVEGVE